MAESMQTGWYYLPSGAPAGQQMGPLSWEQLYAARSAGSLQPATLVWHPTMSQWTPASQIQGLFPAAQPGYRQTPSYPPPAHQTAPYQQAAYPQGAYQPGGYQPAAYQQAAPSRSRMWAWLLPLIALVLVGGGLGAYFGFFYDKGTGSKNVTAADLEGTWEGTFTYSSLDFEGLTDEQEEYLKTAVGKAVPLTMDVSMDGDGQGVARLTIDMSSADTSFSSDVQTLYFTYSEGKLDFDSEESGAKVSGKVTEDGDELVWEGSVEFSDDDFGYSGKADFEARKGGYAPSTPTDTPAGGSDDETVSLDGHWEGTIHYTELDLGIADMTEEDEAMRQKILSTPIPMTMDLTTDGLGNGDAEMTIDLTVIDPSGGTETQSLNFTFDGKEISFQSTESETMTGKLTQEDGRPVLEGEMRFNDEEGSGEAEWSMTKAY